MVAAFPRRSSAPVARMERRPGFCMTRERALRSGGMTSQRTGLHISMYAWRFRSAIRVASVGSGYGRRRPGSTAGDCCRAGPSVAVFRASLVEGAMSFAAATENETRRSLIRRSETSESASAGSEPDLVIRVRAAASLRRQRTTGATWVRSLARLGRVPLSEKISDWLRKLSTAGRQVDDTYRVCVEACGGLSFAIGRPGHVMARDAYVINAIGSIGTCAIDDRSGIGSLRPKLLLIVKSIS